MPLQRHNTENSKQIFPEKELRGFSSNFHIHVSVSDLYVYSYDRSAYSVEGKSVDRSWQYINCSQTHECGNWVGTKAAQFPFLEYINGIFVAVWLVRFAQRYTTWFSPQHSPLSFLLWLKQYCEGLLKPESCSCLVRGGCVNSYPHN
jgi:hypothetical protein